MRIEFLIGLYNVGLFSALGENLLDSGRI